MDNIGNHCRQIGGGAYLAGQIAHVDSAREDAAPIAMISK